MEPYYESKLGRLFLGDCLEVLPEIEPVDSILVDPPYGLHFMGKKWDYDIPSVDTFKLMLDIAKPGATMFCFAGSRTQHRMAVNIEDAGWILKDCIMWVYGSGFPKATDISKQIDKMAGVKGEKYIREDFAKRSNKTEQRKSQVICGQKGVYNKPATPEAKLWNGWKSHGLKPAYEPIIVAMKPNEGSYAENALKHGVAGLNIDGGRIEAKDGVPKFTHRQEKIQNCYGDGKNGSNRTGEIDTITGRYPANIILDEEVGRLLDLQSGERKAGGLVNGTEPSQTGQNGIYSIWGRVANKPFDDIGGASRFFYCAKASKSERNAGLSGNKQKRDESRSHGQAGADNPYNRGAQKVTNHHPTVKPLKLMEYLLTLLKTPTGGTCLDCFAGSGTTGIACERLNRKYILIEKEEKYAEIAAKRIESEAAQLKLFG